MCISVYIITENCSASCFSMHKCTCKPPLLACVAISPFTPSPNNSLSLSLSRKLLTMLFFLVSCLSFLLLSHIKSRVHKSPLVFREFFVLLNQKRKIFLKKFQIPTFFPPIKNIPSPKSQFLEKTDEEKKSHKITLLDLPDLALDCILEKLSPVELCSMAGVCSSMREKCTSDHLWEKLMREKWGDVIGDAAYREWQSQLASKRHRNFLHSGRSGFGLFSGLFGFFGPELEKKISVLPMNSVMSCYLALESGKFWFPAQVFNRENGHVGFMLSCYDAHLSYGSTTDNFIARYKSQGRSMIEEGIEWKMIRAPSVDTPPNVLHISDCLNQLKPNDHIEIQWRKNKAFPYGWWYGVVGHLHSCTANEFNCHCHASDTIILEFKQYAPGSRWRKTMISRKEHREVGNEADGFYGGIRKLSKKEEIEKWKQLWPNCTLE